MPIIEDTRQKVGEHRVKNEYWESIGETVIRCRLPVGDYCSFYSVAVDTKRNIDELAANVGSDHVRFKRECLLARDNGCKLVILVENDIGITCLDDLKSWTNPRAWEAKKKGMRAPIDGERLSKACKTMTERYGVEFDFCAPGESGKRVIEILEGG